MNCSGVSLMEISLDWNTCFWYLHPVFPFEKDAEVVFTVDREQK
jgi:hypothetical protein